MERVDEIEGLPNLDYTDPHLRGERFDSQVAELRAHGWLATGPYGYIILDHEAGEHFLRSRDATFPGRMLMELFEVKEGPLFEEMSRNILHVNGPDHSRLRSLLNPSLTPRAVQRHRPALRKLLIDLYAEMVEGAEPSDAGAAISCEFVSQLSMPYPAQAIAAVLGAPISDHRRLNHWSQWVQRQFDAASMVNEREQIEVAVAELYEYLHALLAQRRDSPGDDLISTLLSAEAEGDKLSEVECVNLVLDVLIGGIDTTQSQLAHALRLFAEHPEQWDLLSQRGELVPQAVEEVLRWAPVTPFTARIVERDLAFRDVIFPQGTIVMVCAKTGNVDGVSGGFDITREEEMTRSSQEGASATEQSGAPRVLTFGAGIHNCVGANLAKAELEEALAFLAPRMRDLSLNGEPQYGSITGIYGLDSLPLRFTPATV